MEAILDFGQSLSREADREGDRHLLVHCHMGVSRSTAAMAAILAQANPELDENRLFADLLALRPQMWPNSVMVAHADELLGRGGRLTEAFRRVHGRQLLAKPQFGEFLRRNGRGREVDMAVKPEGV